MVECRGSPNAGHYDEAPSPSTPELSNLCHSHPHLYSLYYLSPRLLPFVSRCSHSLPPLIFPLSITATRLISSYSHPLPIFYLLKQLSYTGCLTKCLGQVSFKCETFSYCYDSNECLLSAEVVDSPPEDNQLVQEADCVVVVRKWKQCLKLVMYCCYSRHSKSIWNEGRSALT